MHRLAVGHPLDVCYCVDAGKVQQLPQKAYMQKQAKRNRPAAAKPLDPAAAQLAAVTATVELHQRNLQRAIYQRQKVKYGLLQMKQGVKNGHGPRSGDCEEGNATSVSFIAISLRVMPGLLVCLLVCCRGSSSPQCWYVTMLDTHSLSCATAVAVVKCLCASAPGIEFYVFALVLVS